MKKFYTYYNLHKHLFSLKNLKTGRVERRENSVLLKNCTFKVSQKGRERVLREKRKNVHAGVVGEYVDSRKELMENMIEITYNPYLYDSFVLKHSKRPVKKAEFVLLRNKQVFAVGVEWVIFITRL